MRQALLVGIVAICLLGVLLSGCSDEPEEKEIPYHEFTPNYSMGPSTIIYKTKGDHYKLVPVLLNENKTEVVGYPDPTDVYYKGELAYPAKLVDGYLLDNRGVGVNSAFLDITYEEYSKLGTSPSSSELFDMIKDDNPFTEMWNLGSRYSFDEENEVEEINSVIAHDQLDKAKQLI